MKHYYLDDTLSVRSFEDCPKNACKVVFDDLDIVVHVFSYLPNCQVEDWEALEIACDYLEEIGQL